MNKKDKSILIVICVILMLFILILSFCFNLYLKDDKDFCLDTGICVEGIKTRNKEGILFEVTKENCIKYGYKWNIDKKECNFR